MRPLLPQGPPHALAPILDRAAEWWATRTPRARAVLRLLAVALLVAVAARPGDPGLGPSTTVLVARSGLPAGHVVAQDDVREAAWPTALLPDRPDGRPSPDDVVGSRLAVGVPAGLPVLAAHLSGPSLADRAPPDHVVVGIDATRLPDVPVGAVVDLHGGDGASVRGAVVLEAAEEVVWLAVPRAATPTLAAALAWGEVLVGVVSTAG